MIPSSDFSSSVPSIDTRHKVVPVAKLRIMLLIFLIAFLLVLVLIYLRKCQKTWQNRGFPSTSPNLLFGDIGDSVWGRKMISFVVDDIYKKYPNEKLVGFYEFFRPNLLIRDPQLIESVLVKDFSTFTDRLWIDSSGNNKMSKHLFMMRGKQWKDLRTKLITTFSTNKLKLMVSLMDRCAQIMDTLVEEKCGEESVDMKEIMSRFATDVIGYCIFGLKFNTLTEPESEYRIIGKKMFNPNLKALIIGFLRVISPKTVALLKLTETAPEVEEFFSNLLRQSEDFRKKESFRRNDLMQLILDIRDRDRERAQCKEYDDVGKYFVLNLLIHSWLTEYDVSIAEEMIDDDTVLSNIFIFYMAGFETTASTLSFCLYELSFHPECQQRLREEIRALLETNENVASYEVLKKMTYAEMVISETLRKYPPVGFLFRVCNESYQLPESSLQLFRGDRVTIPVLPLHFDEKYYPNPEKFDPDRFTPENISARPPYTYLPFGDGPRMCLAIRFAKMEMKLCLARIISKYEFLPSSKTEIPLQMHSRSFLLNPKNGIQLRVRPATKGGSS
ncbi:hypothetical protein V9T40_012145 [Parthenolecanium corni]|uniref:Cytochrome P450 n=1 Tax=Parthenolecanium corni TaxID=536013 RepID=A0AAN9T846_9HEMI